MTKLPPWQDPEVRRLSIGSSDIGCILGVSTFKSPTILYLEKRGELEPAGESEYQRWGQILEEPIAREYTHRTGTKLKRRNKTQRHKLYEWMTSHIDREAIGRRLIVEVKAHGIWGAKEFGDEGSDQVPHSHMAQVNWQMGICDIPQTDFAVLIGGQKFCQYHVDYDKELFAMMLAHAEEFWARVQEGRPPEPESEADCKALWPSATRSVVVATAPDHTNAELYHRYKRQLADCKFELQGTMEDYEVLEDEDGNVLATYKNTSSTRFDSKTFKAENPELHKKYLKTTTSRRLLIKERKDT